MFTKIHKWRRWSGSRDAVAKAMELASDELARWNDFPSSVDVRISFVDQLTETSADPQAVAFLSKTDLSRVSSLWVDVKADRELWASKHEEFVSISRRKYERIHGITDLAPWTANDAELVIPKAPPRLIQGIAVSIRFVDDSHNGLTIEVAGPNRTEVAGLMTRLEEVFDHAALSPTFVPSRKEVGLNFAVGSVFGLSIGFAGFAILGSRSFVFPLWLDFGAAMVFGLLFAGLQWTLPPIELLDNGDRSRFQRFRLGVLSVLVTFVVGLFGNAVWALKK